MVLLTLGAIMGGVLYLAHWIKGLVREHNIARALAIENCKRIGHDVYRVHAFGDPRWPVDKCRRCPWQHDVRYLCPHCGEEIVPNGKKVTDGS
jgi:hypothetical protein